MAVLSPSLAFLESVAIVLRAPARILQAVSQLSSVTCMPFESGNKALGILEALSESIGTLSRHSFVFPCIVAPAGLNKR